MTYKDLARLVFDVVLAEFPVRNWMAEWGVDMARRTLEEMTEDQCFRIIAKAKLILTPPEQVVMVRK